MFDNQKSFKFINKDLLFNENKLKNTLYDSLNLFDKLKLIKNFNKNKQNINNRSESIFNESIKNIGQVLFFAIMIIVTILAFIGYVYCAYLVIIDYSFGDHQFMKYLGWAFTISFVITGFLLLICMLDDADFEAIIFIIFVISVIMCLGLNLLIGFVLGKLSYMIIALNQIQFSNKFKKDIDNIENNFMDYFNEIVYTSDKKAYYLHELIQSINIKDYKDINQVMKCEFDLTFINNDALTEDEINDYMTNTYDYPNSDEQEALKLLLLNDQARTLNFKQVILKLKQLEKLTQLSESQKQTELNKHKSQLEQDYLNRIEQLAEQFKPQQDTADEINKTQFNSIVNYK